MKHVGDILNLSYDVRRLMDDINSSAEKLEQGVDNVATLAERIKQTAAACSDFCNRSLEKYAGNSTAARQSEVYLAELLQDIKDQLQNVYGDAVVFDIHCVPDSSDRMDKSSLNKLLHSLLKQAADATIAAGNGGKVSVYVHRRGHDWKIDVRDAGAGLDERLVRQFAERANEVAHRGGSYNDLGLPSLFALATEMGGRLALKHTGKQGSAFRLSLPSSKPLEGVALTSKM